jgi:hypothetical protein
VPGGCYRSFKLAMGSPIEFKYRRGPFSSVRSHRELDIKDLMLLDAFGFAWIRPGISNGSRSVESIAQVSKTSNLTSNLYIGSSTTIPILWGHPKEGSRTEHNGRGTRAVDLGSAEDP